MSVLHLVAAPGALDACVAHVVEGDAVLLLGDGVHAAADPRLAALDAPVAAIDEDAAGRAVALPPPVRPLGYDGFVALVVDHDASVSWT